LLKKKNRAYIFGSFPAKKVIALFSDRFYNLGFYNNTPQELRLNRFKFLKKFGIDYRNLICVKQPHNNKIILAKGKLQGKGALDFKSAISGADGLITNEKSLALAVFTADCLSIFLFDHRNKAIGLVHAGWRGTCKRIAENAVFKMKENFNTKPKDLIAAFGPAIRGCCYEVGKDFKKYFKKDLIKRKNKFYLDIISANLRQLIKAGVKSKNIFDSKICTSCKNKEFFSFRREGNRSGRMISLIMLR
jgi:YfiH family protein